MKKSVIAKIENDSIRTLSVPCELRKLSYGNSVWHEKDAYYIMGKKNIQAFVESMKGKIQECRKTFKDEESVREFELDDQFLNSLLKLKAI